MKVLPSFFPLNCQRARACLVAVLCLLGLAQPKAQAIPVTINTTALTGQSGLIAFDLIGGDSTVANNTVSVDLLATDGVLDNAAPFTVTDLGFFNEVLREVTFGTFLSFSLALTENVSAPGFDQFSFFLLDPITFLPLFRTSDPFGADALFAIDITGARGGAAVSFDPIQSAITWQVGEPPVQAVPDGGMSVALLGAGLVGLTLLRHRLGAG